jgi:hypothetical protein
VAVEAVLLFTVVQPPPTDQEQCELAVYLLCTPAVRTHVVTPEPVAVPMLK